MSMMNHTIRRLMGEPLTLEITLSTWTDGDHPQPFDDHEYHTAVSEPGGMSLEVQLRDKLLTLDIDADGTFTLFLSPADVAPGSDDCLYQGALESSSGPMLP